MPIVASFAEIHIYLLRLPAHYIYNIVIPASALSILAVLAFFIPIEEGERLGFGMTIFLSFMVLMLQVSSILPENSKSVSAVGRFIFQFQSLLKLDLLKYTSYPKYRKNKKNVL